MPRSTGTPPPSCGRTTSCRPWPSLPAATPSASPTTTPPSGTGCWAPVSGGWPFWSRAWSWWSAGAAPSGPEPAMPKWRQAARALAGPALIGGAVCILMRGFLAGRISAQHPDILAYWLPTYCHLGRSLAAGHIPAWNPAVMGGVPFAADPQSGWMYLPVMALFAALPCGAALAATIVLNPILAGLGIYWFARAEGLSPPAATVGGLALAVLLAAAAGFVRATTWPARLGWAGLAAGAWGQLAAAHAGHGLVIGTAAVGTYLAAALIRSV